MPCNKDFPVVGVGASAGGLDAFKALLNSLPPDTGAAFVLILHLDPNHPSMMAALLARQTGMSVVQAEDDMALSPNTVHVIPPGKFIRLVDHRLCLDDPVTENGARMSIDHFFRSLAEARGEQAIGIVLSGTGSDGTVGIREIKAAGGIVLVQTPEEAGHAGMPRSAIATGDVDFVLPVAEMPGRLEQVLRTPDLHGPRPELVPLSGQARDGFTEILRVLRARTGYDFRSYKKGTVERRIQRRMGLGRFKDLADYVAYLRNTPEEAHLLSRDLLIGVTRFFREPEAWETFGDKVIEPLLDRKPDGATIRAWVPGCATGEEAYTLAMILFDRIDRRRSQNPVQVFATDLNDRAIEAARAGTYPLAAMADIPDDMLDRHFTDAGDKIMVDKRLRDTVVFATQNVISDPPFSRLDLITCRNLMIYLEPDVQSRMVEMFHFALADDGHLFLGNSENAERPGRLFVTVDKANRIYRKNGAVRVRSGSFPIVPGGKREARMAERPETELAYASGSDTVRRQLMERFVPASVIVDAAMDVQYFHGPVRQYLDFPAGEPTSRLPEIALPPLRGKVRAVLNAVLSGKDRAEAVALNVPRATQEVGVRVCAELLNAGEGAPSILVYFRDVSEPRDASERKAAGDTTTPEERDAVASLEYELLSTREDLQSTIEEMETSNEELKASNEEVMSMNEELQSTNEELETSREELQSLNEELTTVNSQLEEKIEEVEQANNDLTNLLVSIDIGVIFLDTNLLIRWFTPAITEVMRIIDSDVGRAAEDIAMRVQDPDLIAEARRCLDKLVEIEAEISTDTGEHRIRRLRPYRTSENRIEGVVVTYTDVTTLQIARASIRRREAQQEAVAELGRVALSGASLNEVFDLSVKALARHLNVRYTKVLQLDPDGRSLTLRAGVGWHSATVGTSQVDSGTDSQAGYTMERRSAVVVKDFGHETRFAAPPLLKDHSIVCGASVLIGPQSAPWGVLGVHESDLGRCTFDEDDTNFLQSMAHVLWLVIARDRAVAAIEAERAQLQDLTDSLPILFAIVNAEQRYEFVNKGYTAWGLGAEEIQGKRIADVLDADGYSVVAPRVAAALRGEDQRFEVKVHPFGASDPRFSLVSYAPRLDATGEVTGFYSASIDITEQKRLERDLEERFDQYRTLGESISFGAWITDAEGRLSYVSQAFLDLTGMTFDEARDHGWLACLAPETLEETARLWQDTLRTGRNWEKEHRVIGADGRTYHVLALGRPIRDGDGRITSWVGLNLDITDRKAEAERLTVISAELDHRVKNILATVSTIARMTGRSATSLEQYRDSLQDRIRAMAAAHNLLADSDWQGMDLRSLIETEIGPYRATHENAISVEGPDIVLPPRLVQTLALAFHELTTNSTKYGALSRIGGRIDIGWRYDQSLEIAWIESGMTGVERPATEGFGTALLTRIIAAQGATVSLDYPDSGIQVRISLDDVH